MKFYSQTDKRNCGQIAVAAITERTVEEIEQIVGHNHGTKTKELIAALHACGFECGKRCARAVIVSPHAFGIAQLHSPDRAGWHWVAVGEGKFWDGHFVSGAWPIEAYLELCSRANCHITSLLEVKRP